MKRTLSLLGAGLLLGPAPLFAQSAFDQLVQAAPGTAVVEAPGARAAAADDGTARGKAEGIGLAHSGDPFDIPDFSLAEVARLLREAGGTHYRPHLPLNEAKPELSAADLARLRQAAADPAVLEAMTAELAADGRWERMDGLVRTFTQAGIKLILVAGAGYRKEAPLYALPDGTKDRVSPDRIGRDVYIALTRWLVGAGVRRYGDRVEFWQVENEINTARMVSWAGWRVNEDSWGDAAFRKKLLAGLCATVHDEGRRLGRSLKTTQNFATDAVSWQGWIKSGGQVFLTQDIGTFGGDGLDIVGIDIYANYLNGWPMRKGRVERVIAEAVAAAKGRPVWILETGFPQAPALRGYSEARQAEYFRSTFDAAYSRGVSLVLGFGWFWNPKGWFTDSPAPPPWWSPQACEGHWSPITVSRRPDGTQDVRFGEAWSVLQDAARRWVAP